MHNEFAPQVFLSPPAPPALHSYYKLYSNQIQTATITMANQLNAAAAAAAGMLIGSFSQYTLVQYRKTREMTGSLHVAIAYRIGITTFPPISPASITSDHHCHYCHLWPSYCCSHQQIYLSLSCFHKSNICQYTPHSVKESLLFLPQSAFSLPPLLLGNCSSLHFSQEIVQDTAHLSQ